jgi:hypothetical protein
LNNIQVGSWSFNEIELEDMEMYSEYIKNTEYPANLWSSNFAYLWASSQSNRRKILWKIVDGMLVTFAYSRKNVLYLMCLPFGKGNPEEVVAVLFKCLKYCCEWNNNDFSSSIVKTVNSLQMEFLEKAPMFRQCFKTIPLVGIEKHFSIQSIVSLYGKQFRNIREKINKFRKLYPNAIIRKYVPEDYDEILHLGEYWSETSGKKYSRIFDTVYFREIIKHCDELNHLVLVIELENKIIGMISGGELPTGQSWGCLSKFMSEFEGLSEFMIIEFARELHKTNPNIEYENTGSDLGPGGLRFFKDKFRPALNLKRYGIQLKMP